MYDSLFSTITIQGLVLKNRHTTAPLYTSVWPKVAWPWL
jgi:hypothetical protein